MTLMRKMVICSDKHFSGILRVSVSSHQWYPLSFFNQGSYKLQVGFKLIKLALNPSLSRFRYKIEAYIGAVLIQRVFTFLVKI